MEYILGTKVYDEDNELELSKDANGKLEICYNNKTIIMDSKFTAVLGKFINTYYKDKFDKVGDFL